MIAESGDEMMEDSDALYRDEDEDALIVEDDIESTATPAAAAASVPAEVEMAPVDGGAVPVEVDEVLEVEEEGGGGLDIEVLPQTGEERVGGGGEDVAFEEAETAGEGEESSSKVDGEVVTGEEIVLEEKPSAEERKEEAAPPPSIEPSTASVDSTATSLPLPTSISTPLSPDAESFVIVEAPSDSETNGKLEEAEERKEDEVDPAENEGQSPSLSSAYVCICSSLTRLSLS